jgi:hypothetical protein
MINPSEYIVAECSRNWIAGDDPRIGTMLCQQFEQVLNVNMARGYTLRDWQLSRVVSNVDGVTCLNETIIAVFYKGIPA